jgi:hypothetical protein
LGESVSSNPMCSLTILASARMLIFRLLADKNIQLMLISFGAKKKWAENRGRWRLLLSLDHYHG